MSRESLFGVEKLPDDRSIIVVSDLHLGGGEDPGTSVRFYRFLKYLTGGEIFVTTACLQGNAAKDDDSSGMKRLFPPEKMILLGDILELWDSRNQDRNSSFLDAFLPFLKLRDMDCDVIYVTGNHDEDVAEFISSRDYDRIHSREKEPSVKKDSLPVKTGSDQTAGEQYPAHPPSDFQILHVKDRKGKERAESLKVMWNSSRTLEVCSRHYPAHRAKDGEIGIVTGGTSYAFIHGQQFDREQVTHTISEALGRRFDPVDFFQDLACISVTRRITPFFHVLNLVLAIFLLWLFFTPAYTPVITLMGLLSGVILAIVFLYGLYLFGYAERNHPSSSVIAAICTVVLAVDVILLFTGVFFTYAVYNGFFYIPFIVSLYIFLVISIPALFAYLKRRMYNVISSKFKSPGKIIGEKLFDVSKYAYKSKVLVFGHTHVADFEADTQTDKVSLLVNTGSWVREPRNEAAKDYDTFVYIDSAGVCCLRWNDKAGMIECYCKAKDDLQQKVPLCRYIAEKGINLKG